MKKNKEQRVILWSLAIVAFGTLGIGTFYVLNLNGQRIEERSAERMSNAMDVKKKTPKFN